jgi:hypothetical protein
MFEVDNQVCESVTEFKYPGYTITVAIEVRQFSWKMENN